MYKLMLPKVVQNKAHSLFMNTYIIIVGQVYYIDALHYLIYTYKGTVSNKGKIYSGHFDDGLVFHACRMSTSDKKFVQTKSAKQPSL